LVEVQEALSSERRNEEDEDEPQRIGVIPEDEQSQDRNVKGDAQ